MPGYIFWIPCYNNLTSFLTSFRTQIDYPVCILDYIHVVLYNKYGIALGNKPLEYGDEPFYIGKMKACCGFIEDKKHGTPIRGFQITRKLESLGLSPGKGIYWLTERYIAKPHIS